MMTYDIQPLILTFKLATVTTAILLIIAIPFAWWLANTKIRFKPVVESLVSMPLVLPPSVLGFYLLLAFSPEHWFGSWLDKELGIRLAFSFAGLVIASVIFSFPFIVHPVQAAFQNLPKSLTDAAKVLGKSNVQIFFRVLLPNIKPALISGTVLAFAHTVGEFGVVMMIGGNLPNSTRVASIAIYDEVESLHYDVANFYAGVLVLSSFAILMVVYMVNRKARK
ncbi:MAG: molybdate ABC transporter permease subunit [Methylotenera sp.]|uniref:molybdate ABC transporter permease subunit n=1 Tax=Methylotenera sp. TaxID=2051956 RepID=UPI0024898D80|nr:molybdate ABC transporter permease subunit [Methylotenera sp.]MDI1310419.1 molybdate ABC transporter permease subunit [Methylotenera sp.]